MLPTSTRNFVVVPVILGAWGILLLARLVHLQVFQYESLRSQARRQQERTIEVSPVRGIIYDRNLHPLAVSVEVDSVFAVPGEIAGVEATSKLLAPVLDMAPAEVRARLERSSLFSWIKRKVSAGEAARIRQLNLRGIYFQKESKRFYPKRELAAHVLGHVGVDDQGLAGIELTQEEAIRGRPGQLLIERDARQRWFRRTGRPPVPGEPVVLTLDETIQHIAEQELAAVMEQSRARSGTVVVQDPWTGEILAMANAPTFNPNLYREASPDALRNLAIAAAYEPGSTFKIITLAAALDEGLADPEEIVDCQMGAIVLAGHVIHDHKAFGLLTVRQILQLSSDVGAIKLALRVGNQDMYRYLRTFGFGSPTGIELPGEALGLTKPPERWSKISIGAIAMGQEIGVTPLQLTSAVSAVANGGWRVQPRILRENSPAGPGGPGQPRREQKRRVITPETAEILQTMMAQVVSIGTGKLANLDGYAAGGKTGTAQKIDPATRAYSRTDHVASFVGFAPVESPLFTILVVLDSPRGRYHGGDVAAPIFKRVAEQILAYRKLPPLVPGKPSLVPVAASRPRAMASSNLPLAEEVSETISTITPAFDAGSFIPDFLGKTVRGVTEESLAGNLPVELIGSGIAFRQFPPPGGFLPGGYKIRIWFRVGGAAESSEAVERQPLAAPRKTLPIQSEAGVRSPASG